MGIAGSWFRITGDFMTRLLSIVLAFWLAVAASVSQTSETWAQPPDDQLGESLGFVVLFPQLRNLPAPTWFRPGVRVSYETIGANFDGGGAAGGIIQYDVVGLDAGWSMVLANNLSDNGAGALIPLGAAPTVGLPAVGEFWIHPIVLIGAEAVANQNLSVTRLNKQYLGQTVQVVRFQSTTQGGQTVWEFNANSGLLMFYSRSTQGSAVQLLVTNFRTLALPTQGARAPNWVRPGARMEYTGTRTQTIGGGSPIGSPYAVTTQVVGATPTWSVQTQQAFLNNTPVGENRNASGIGQIFGGIWLPREALARINAQETVIDQDPVTGAQLSVGRTNNGTIFLRELNQAYETILFYNSVLGSLDGFIQTVGTLTGLTRIDIGRSGGSDLAQLNSLPELINTLLQPGVTVRPNQSVNQTVRVDLPNTILTLGLPSGTVGEPFNVTVNTASGVPAGPANLPPAGDPFELLVRSSTTGGPIGTFAGPANFQIQLPVATAANDGTPALHFYNGSSWQRLGGSYNESERTVAASHNRSGLYAVFVVSDSGDDNNGNQDDQSQRVFLPTLLRQ